MSRLFYRWISKEIVMVISEIVIIVMFILLVVSIIGNAAFIGLYVSHMNAKNLVEFELKQRGFDEQKERVDKTLHERRQ